MSDWADMVEEAQEADWIEWRARNPRPTEPRPEPMYFEALPKSDHRPRGRAVDMNLPHSPGSTLHEDIARALAFLEAESMHFEFAPSAEALARLLPPEEPQKAPETPRERALRLRKTRNTGPARPAAQNAHRPRKGQS